MNTAREPNGLGSIAQTTRGETLGAQVRANLRSAIMAGKFVPGEKLTIRAVAAALGVSLTPAREALFNLAAEGVLETRANGSVHIPQLDADAVREIMVIRQSLEGAAAREAARNFDDAVIRKLQKINDGIIDADRKDDFRRLIDLNWRFHFTIYELSGMPYLVRLIEGCWLKTGSYLNVLYPHYSDYSTGIENHVRIIEAVIARDAEKLRRAIRRDISSVSKSLLAHISRGSSSNDQV